MKTSWHWNGIEVPERTYQALKEAEWKMRRRRCFWVAFTALVFDVWGHVGHGVEWTHIWLSAVVSFFVVWHVAMGIQHIVIKGAPDAPVE